MPTYVAKPTQVEAWKNSMASAIPDWTARRCRSIGNGEIVIPTAYGPVVVGQVDYVIKISDGILSFAPKGDFEASHELLEPAEPNPELVVVEADTEVHRHEVYLRPESDYSSDFVGGG